MDLLPLFKIAGSILAGVTGISSIFLRTKEDNGRITKSGLGLLAGLIIGSVVAIGTEALDQSSKEQEKYIEEAWRQVDNQEIVGFGYDLLFKENTPVHEVLLNFNFVALDVSSIFDGVADLDVNAILGRQKYIYPPGVAFGMFIWSQHLEEGESGEIWSATFDLSKENQWIYSLSDLPHSGRYATPVTMKKFTSYLQINPSVMDDVSGKFITPRNKMYGVMRQIILDPNRDYIGGLSGRGAWRPLGLIDRVETIQDLTRIPRVDFLMPPSLVNERLDSLALSFTTSDGTELKGFFYDLNFKVHESQPDYVVASVNGRGVYSAIKERFTALKGITSGP